MAIQSFLFLVAVSILVSCSSITRRHGETEDAPIEAATRSTPRIGLILGPGGMKSFAHIGVLREFERAKIPIHGVIGLEWGSLIGALYAKKAKVNDVEWQMLKLKKDSVISNRIFRPGQDTLGPEALDAFLEASLSSIEFEKLEVPFSCPTVTASDEGPRWLTQGVLKEAIKACLPYPPLYKSTSMAAPFDVRGAAQKLREMGADIVVFVNVLAQGAVYRGQDAMTQILWRELRQTLARETEGIDFVVGIHTRDYDISNYDNRRSLMLFGNQAGAIAVRKLSDRFGL